MGPQRGDLLKKELSIFTFKDLLELYPYRHVDKTKVSPISDINLQTDFIQVAGVLVNMELVGDKRAKRLVAQLKDKTGILELAWFQSVSWIQKYLEIGKTYLVYGKVGFYGSKAQIIHPEMELFTGIQNEAKKFESGNLHFFQHDIRLPFYINYFDYAFNFFTSFGYFNNTDDDNKVVSNIFTALKPGGLLVMDYINAAYAEKRLTASEEKDIDGIVYHISRWTDDEHIFKKISIDEELFGRPLEYTEQVKKFSLNDFKKLFKNNGLRLINVFGDYQLNGYNSEASPRIITIAKKITDESNLK